MLVGSLALANSDSVYVSGRYAYVIALGSDDLKVIDVSDPSAPSLTGSPGHQGRTTIRVCVGALCLCRRYIFD